MQQRTNKSLDFCDESNQQSFVDAWGLNKSGIMEIFEIKDIHSLSLNIKMHYGVPVNRIYEIIFRIFEQINVDLLL